MKHDALLWAALAAVLVVLASAEYHLAAAAGFGQYVAAGLPMSLDIYALAALRARRDVFAVVLVLVAVNAASHLVAVGMLPVSVALVVAVSALPPVILWRVHRLSETAQLSGSGQLPVTTEVTTPAGAVSPIGDTELPPVPVRPALPDPPRVVIPPAVPGPWKTGAAPAPVTTTLPAQTARQVVTLPVARTPSELRREARRLNREAVRSTNRPVTIRALQDELRLSRREATELRREVVDRP
ncbi:hypothetical protein [Streptomyces griseoaurantiacus]|uniref:hypothetical protein n=1 Tax=Streptomyces griseoaurantiacus TaxID=68213 RepID=UPI00345F32F8